MPRRFLSHVGGHDLTDYQVCALAVSLWRDDGATNVEHLSRYYRVVLDSLVKKGLFARGRQGSVVVWTRTRAGFELAREIERMIARGEVEPEESATPQAENGAQARPVAPPPKIVQRPAAKASRKRR